MNLLKRQTLLFLVSILPGSFVLAQPKTCPTFGPYIIGKDMTHTGELWYTEVMVEKDCLQPNSYYSTLNFRLGSRGGYAGIQNKPYGEGAAVDKANPRDRNNIFSLWDKVNNTQSHQCKVVYTAPGTFSAGFKHEGTGIHTINNMMWKPGVWYATVVRRWSVGDGKTYIGFFMYDYETRTWKHYTTGVTPDDNVMFTLNSISGFEEKIMGFRNKDSRCGYYRNFWGMNTAGKWSKPDHYTVKAGPGSWHAEAAFDNTAIKVTTCGADPGPEGGQLNFNLAQPGSKPATTIPVAITNATATYNSTNRKVHVTWTTSDTTSPQLSYDISVVRIPVGGVPVPPYNVASARGIYPEKRSVDVTLPPGSFSKEYKYYVTLLIKDIFNQVSPNSGEQIPIINMQ